MTSSAPVPAEIPLGPPAIGLLVGFAAGHPFAHAAPAAALCAYTLLAALAWRTRWRRAALSVCVGALAAWNAVALGEVPAQAVQWARPGFHVFEGRVESMAPPGPHGARMVLRTSHLGEGADRVRRCIRLTLRLPSRTTWSPAPGTQIRAACFVRRRGSRVSCHLVPESVEVLESAGPWRRATHALRLRATRRLEEVLAPSDAGLARALIAGDKTRLTWADRRRFRETGQAHLLAVSGLHVGLLVAGFIFLLRRIGLGARATWIAGIVIVAVFVPFAGAPKSAVRAGLGAALYLSARLLGRSLTGIGVLAAVVVAVFATDAEALAGLSLQLSLAAVLGILMLGPPITDALTPDRLALPGLATARRGWIRPALAVAFGAWLGTAPIVMGVFGRVCLIGAPLSVVAFPFAAALVALGFLLLVASPVPALAGPLADGFAITADALRSLFDFVDTLGLGGTRVAAPSVPFMVLYLGLATAVRYSRRSRVVLTAGGGMVALVALATRFAGEHGYDPTSPAAGVEATALVSGWHLALTGTGLLAFAALSVRLGWLTAAGAAGATLLGLMTAWQFGGFGLLALVVTFLVTTLASKLPGRHRSGARTLRQVVANGAGPFLGGFLWLAGWQDTGFAVFVAGLSFLGADTLAAEIGVRYGGSPRRLLHPGEPLAAGQSGGVTMVGFAASAVGAMLPAAALVLPGEPIEAGRVWFPVFAGLLGGIVDSLLGDTLQYRGRSLETGAITERRVEHGEPTQPFSGLPWLDNDMVNLVSGLVAGALGALLSLVRVF